MAGIHESNVIDLVTHSPLTGGYTVIMIEWRPWTDSCEQLAELSEKINNYAMFILDGGLARIYPQTAAQSVSIQLDCTDTPSPKAQALIEAASARLLDYHVPFVVNVIS